MLESDPHVIQQSRRDARNVRLLHVLRIVIRADSDPSRQALFANLMQSRLWVRFAFWLHHHLRSTWADTIVIGSYGLVSFLGVAPPRRRGARLLAVAQHANARRQVDRVCAWVGASGCDLVRIGTGALLEASTLGAVALLVRHGRAGEVLRVARAIERRHGLLVACRAIRVIAWYGRARTMMRRQRPGALLVSSDSNPEELAFLGAARALDIPQIYISHAYPTPLSPPLDFTLSIMEGEAAVEARRRKGPLRGAVLLAGVEGDSAPIDVDRFRRPQPVIGIFTPKAVAWPTMVSIVEDCRRHFQARQIVIRWHPSMLEPPHLADWVPDRSGIVESPRTAPLGDVARQCDWVVADENSNVHLPVLKLGIPTLAVRNLGVYPPSRADQYGFVANGVVFPAVTSIRDVDGDAFCAFFSEDWARRFEHYDVSYRRPQDAIGAEVRRAVQSLLNGVTPAAPAP